MQATFCIRLALAGHVPFCGRRISSQFAFWIGHFEVVPSLLPDVKETPPSSLLVFLAKDFS